MSKMLSGSTDQAGSIRQHLASHDSGVSECLWVLLFIWSCVMKKDWVAQICDRVEQHVQRVKGNNASIVCSSGISPSGPVHLGNLREIMTVHLVVEELRKRGRSVEHIHVWDDYDRLRKIPAGVSPEFTQYLGCPLADVPDPFGEFPSYAERYMNDFMQGLERVGIYPHYIRQSVEYREKGTYRQQIKEALSKRLEIFDILSEYQTLQGRRETLEERRNAYYPYRVYCENCNKDTTTITAYNEVDFTIAYTCQSCNYAGSYSLDEKISGKLVWKVDWPLRWSVLQVDFEPAGEDHASPGSSFTVGLRIVKDVFHGAQPQYVGYAFVGMNGRTKISSSAGTTATLSSALDIIEPCVLRWLYTRRPYNQGFMIDYGQGLLRQYDEWDGLVRQIQAGKANEANIKAYERAIQTSHGPVARTPQPAPFPLLTSVLDVTQGNIEQTLRIASQYVNQELQRDLLEPRLTCALTWVNNYLPEDERTQIRATFDVETYQQLPELDQAGVHMLVEQLDEHWDLEALTVLMYNIPKLVRGLPADATPNDELKQAQRSFFIAIYKLICGTDTGPRIPTLLLSLGREKVKALLSPQEEAVSS
jgi:lysyl-tRNA synthetase class 1